MRILLMCVAVCCCLSTSYATEIGVTAALRGNVVRTASTYQPASIGRLSSGETVYLGDNISIGPKGRMQVLLLDETVFTLGANTVMRIDKFVFDPASADSNSLIASVKRGTFRFVSGKVAQSNEAAMRVKLPAATIGVRGTSAAAEVNADGSASVILLGPAKDNALGLPPGRITVANSAGAINIDRPGYVTEIAEDGSGLPPTPPIQASPAQMQAVELSLFEQASAEIAKQLNVDVEALNLQQGIDSDNDGELDTFMANEVLAAPRAAAAMTSQAPGTLARKPFQPA